MTHSDIIKKLLLALRSGATERDKDTAALLAAEYLAAPEPVNKVEANQDHPNNNLLFKRMCQKFGIVLGIDRIDVALSKISNAAPAPKAPEQSEPVGTKALTHKAIAYALSRGEPLTHEQCAVLLGLVFDDKVWQRECERLQAEIFLAKQRINELEAKLAAPQGEAVDERCKNCLGEGIDGEDSDGINSAVTWVCADCNGTGFIRTAISSTDRGVKP